VVILTVEIPNALRARLQHGLFELCCRVINIVYLLLA